MPRPDKINYYLDIAEAVSKRSTCLRRQYGAIIVSDDEIISTGYNGGTRGGVNCSELGTCIRIEQNIPSGERYELCEAVHAEQNAIISAARRDMRNSILFLVGTSYSKNQDDEGLSMDYEDAKPCLMCSRFIKNAGIKYVVAKSEGMNVTIHNLETDTVQYKSLSSSMLDAIYKEISNH